MTNSLAYFTLEPQTALKVFVVILGQYLWLERNTTLWLGPKACIVNIRLAQKYLSTTNMLACFTMLFLIPAVKKADSDKHPSLLHPGTANRFERLCSTGPKSCRYLLRYFGQMFRLIRDSIPNLADSLRGRSYKTFYSGYLYPWALVTLQHPTPGNTKRGTLYHWPPVWLVWISLFCK